jgi:hypothetical protein
MNDYGSEAFGRLCLPSSEEARYVELLVNTSRMERSWPFLMMC